MYRTRGRGPIGVLSLTMGVGIIGCGYWGPNLIRAFQDCEGAFVAAVCDIDLDRLVRVSRLYPTIRGFQRPEDLFDRPDVRLVAIATPLASHFELAKAAIQRGKHVLVEKPFTRSSSEAEELIDLAGKQGVMLAVDHTFLFTPAVEKIKELIGSGRLGRLHYIDSVRINLGLIREELDVVWDLAPHDLSIVDYLLGRLPIRVVATGRSHNETGRTDVVYINLDYGDGVMVNFHLSWLSPVKVRRMILGGDRRMIIYDDLSSNEKVRVYDRGIMTSGRADKGGRLERIDYREGDIWTPHLSPKEALAVQAEHLVAAIRLGAPLRADGASGLRVVRLLEACTKSLEEDGIRIVPANVPDAFGAVSLPADSLAPSVRHSEPVFADASGLLFGPHAPTETVRQEGAISR